MRNHKHEQGVCPVCNQQDLTYHGTEFNSNTVEFEWECNQCYASGIESYDLNYVGHFNVVDKHGVEIPEHDCPYCGNPSDSSDPDVLCRECREDFGHTFIHEL